MMPDMNVFARHVRDSANELETAALALLDREQSAEPIAKSTTVEDGAVDEKTVDEKTVDEKTGEESAE